MPLPPPLAQVKHASRVAAAKAASHARAQFANFGALADEATAREAAETSLIEVSRPPRPPFCRSPAAPLPLYLFACPLLPCSL